MRDRASAEDDTASVPLPVSNGFRASLTGACLPDLVQMACLSRTEGAFRVISRGRIGYLFFRSGQVVHAMLDDLSGLPAALELLSWDSGTFEPSNMSWPELPTIDDLPPMLGTELLREAGPRVLRLEETLGADGSGPDSIVLRFQQQRLHLRFVPDGVFGVLAEHDVNAASLKMALTLAGRHRRGFLDAGPAVERGSVLPRSSEPSELPPDTRRSPVFSAEPDHESGAPSALPELDDGGVLYRGRRIR